MRLCCSLLLMLIALSSLVSAADPVDLEGVRMEHVMIPMRDGVKLSAFLFFPTGDGPWPVLLEQRYANGARDPGTQKSFAKLARGGYVTVLANFRGSQESEGVYEGYRNLAWESGRTAMISWSGLARRRGRQGKSARLAVRRRALRRTFSLSRSRHI